MSDIEANDQELSQQDVVDDLFGDDDEDEEQQRQPHENDEVNEDIEVNDDLDDDEDENEEEEVEMKTLDISLPRHAALHKTEEDAYTLKMPVFLNVDAHPFDPTEFKEKVSQNAADRDEISMDAKQIQNDLIAEKLLNENTIRWRYTNSGNDEIIKQSNAHFIQWDDGSISLKIGNEMFDYKDLPLYDNFLVKTHDDYEILQNDSILSKSVNLLPSSAFTSTHKKLTQAVKNIQRKDKILNTITDNDPLLKQKLADENEKKSLKMKRQIEMKRRLQEDRLERNNSPVTGTRNSYEPAYERFERTYGNEEYDEEDDFIANDEEEEEEEEEVDDDEEEEEFERGSERLNKLKNEGASKYQDREEEDNDHAPQDTQDEKEREHEGEDEEESKQARKKRRIIDSDEE